MPDLDAPAVSATVFEFEIPNIDDVKMSIELADIPGDARQHLLRTAVRGYVVNRVNAAHQRSLKSPWSTYDEALAAWTKASEAHKADPLTASAPGDAPKAPEGERPAAVNLIDVATKAKADLLKGDIATRDGTAKPRKAADPLAAAITKAVQTEVFQKTRTTNAAYKWPDVVKEVGNDGLAYLNTRIEARVAAAPEAEQANVRKALEKMRDERYVKPARIMLGLDKPKGLADADGIL